MIKHTIEISCEAARRAVKLDQLVIKQYERMHVFWGKTAGEPEEPPQQLQLF